MPSRNVRLASGLAHFEKADILPAGHRSVINAHRSVYQVLLECDGLVILPFELLQENGINSSQLQIIQYFQQQFPEVDI